MKIKANKGSNSNEIKTSFLESKTIEPPNIESNLIFSKVNFKRQSGKESWNKISYAEIKQQVSVEDVDDTDIISTNKQLESIYSSQDGDNKTDAVLTQDSRCQITRQSKRIKKKLLNKDMNKKMNLNLRKSNVSAKKRKRKKSSRSKRRGSTSKKNDDLHKSTLSKKRYHGPKASFSPAKDIEQSINRQPKGVKISHNSSKPNIILQNPSERSRSKKKVRLNKVKSGKLPISKNKIKGTNKMNKSSSKSPKQMDEIQHQPVELMKTSDFKPQFLSNTLKSEGLDKTPLMKQKEIALAKASNEDDNEDFLAFVEKHELMHQINKEKRLGNKELSLASTYAGSTNINKTRPFSGDQIKNMDSKYSYVINKSKIIPNNKLNRPHTAEFHSKLGKHLDMQNEYPMSEALLTISDECNHLPNIQETSSIKTDTEYELSPENSKETHEPSLNKQYEGSPLVVVPKIDEFLVKTTTNQAGFIQSKESNDINHPKIIKSISAHNILLESANSHNLVKYDVVNADKQSPNQSIKNESATELDNLIESLFVPKSSQLNFGSPVEQSRTKKITIKGKACMTKRPSSAGNLLIKTSWKDNMSSNLLASTVHVSREKVMLNLGKTLFYKPEVQSTKVAPEQHTCNVGSRVSSANIYNHKKEKALILIQKYVRGYVSREKVKKMKEVQEMLQQKDKSELHLKDEPWGKGLKLSDLSVEPKTENQIPWFKRTKHKRTITSNDMTGDIEDKSKFDNTQSILMELLKRDNKANKYENSKILDMDVSKRGLANKTDERDLDDKGMNLMIQESPLKFDELEDDITYISSRIETNRKFHNTTIDAIHSTRKSKKLEDEPLKIMQTIKKNKSNNLSAFKENSDIKDAK